jgi:hypothetical protein
MTFIRVVTTRSVAADTQIVLHGRGLFVNHGDERVARRDDIGARL